jgi:hypothetical protein
MRLRAVVSGVVFAVVFVSVCRVDSRTNMVADVRKSVKADRGFQSDFVAFQLHRYATLQQWIELQSRTSGMAAGFDDAARQVAQSHVFLVAGSGLEKLPKRYFLGWMFHLFDLTGRVEDNTLVVSKAEEMSELFRCYQETNGYWKESLDASLMKEVSITGTNRNAEQAFSYLSCLTDVPLLLDRPLLPNEHNFFPPPLDKRITLAFTNAPVGEVISSMLSDLGLTNRIQGGVVFIYDSKKR